MRFLNWGLSVVFLSLASSLAAAPSEEEIAKKNQYKEFKLAQGSLYKIFVKKDDGVTTFTFPSALGKVAGANISLDGTKDFLLQGKPGSYYFNVVALKEGASGTLTVVYNRNTYIIYLEHKKDEAYAVVNFVSGGGSAGAKRVSSLGGIAKSGASVSAARLLSLMDIAKAYDIIGQKYPNDLKDSSRTKFNSIFRYGKFNIILHEVVRFEKEDTLVFKIMLENPTSEEIEYDKFSFTAQVKEKTFFMSSADASGVMPPKSATWAFFTVTGTPNGKRNNLLPDNEFMIGVTTKGQEEEYRMLAEKSLEIKK